MEKSNFRTMRKAQLRTIVAAALTLNLACGLTPKIPNEIGTGPTAQSESAEKALRQLEAASSRKPEIRVEGGIPRTVFVDTKSWGHTKSWGQIFLIDKFPSILSMIFKRPLSLFIVSRNRFLP